VTMMMMMMMVLTSPPIILISGTLPAALVRDFMAAREGNVSTYCLKPFRPRFVISRRSPATGVDRNQLLEFFQSSGELEDDFFF
jgi:hypothetical protein